MAGLEEGKASHAEIPVSSKASCKDQLGPCPQQELEEQGGRRGEARTFFQQLLHLGTRAVIIDDHVKAQVSEALVKSLGISVCSVPDAHTCGNPAPAHDEQSLAEYCVQHHPARHQLQLSDTLDCS